MTDREKAYKYAKLYHLTNNFNDYRNAVIKEFGGYISNEYLIVWEAIDQYVGNFSTDKKEEL